MSDPAIDIDTDPSRLDAWWDLLRGWQREHPLYYEPGGDGEIKPQFMIEAMHRATGGERPEHADDEAADLELRLAGGGLIAGARVAGTSPSRRKRRRSTPR